MCDELTKKKSEAYDLIIQQLRLQEQLQGITQVVNAKIQEIERLKSQEKQKK